MNLKIKEIQALNSVKEFHEKFEHLIQNKAEFPPSYVCDLRAKLLNEELNEFITAYMNGDYIGAIDALMDIQYVLSGAMISFGIGEIAGELFDEVHRSNMSKLCDSDEEAWKTIENDMHKNPSRFESDYKITKTNEKFHVTNIDGKTIKSINYSPADLKNIIDKFDPPKPAEK